MLKQPFIQSDFWGIKRVRYLFGGIIKTTPSSKVIHARRVLLEGQGSPLHTNPSKCLCGVFYWQGDQSENPKGKIEEVTCKTCLKILYKYKIKPDWSI